MLKNKQKTNMIANVIKAADFLHVHRNMAKLTYNGFGFFLRLPLRIYIYI